MIVSFNPLVLCRTPATRLAAVIAALAIAVGVAAPAAAQTPTDPSGGAPKLGASDDAAEKTFGGMIDGRFGFGMVDEDWFLSVNLGGAFRWWKLGIGLQVPLRFRIADNDPQNEGVLREEDWDEVSDWTRVLRYVEWGSPSDQIYARLGVLAGTTFGHGTLVDRYYNVIDADHYQTGVQVNLDFGMAGGQFMLDNLIDPEILGLRGFVRPFQMYDSAPKWAAGITAGITIVSDFAAPLRPAPHPQFGRSQRYVNEDNDLVMETTGAFLFGIDLGWELQPADWVAVTPYTDLNILGQTGGVAYHLGVMTTFDIASVVQLGVRAEYRAISGDMAPTWVNSWYEVERIDYLGGLPKLGFFDARDAAGQEDVLHGWHTSLDLTIMKAVTITAILEDYQGPNNANLMIRLMLPYIAGFRLSAYYAKRNFDEASEAFDLDRGLLVAELKYKFWGPLFAFAQYSREWRLRTDGGRPGEESYETINDWDVGVGAEFTF